MEIILWERLRRAEQRRWAYQFSQLPFNKLQSLSLPVRGLFIQWMFARNRLVTDRVSADAHVGSVDLMLFNSKRVQKEFARIYTVPKNTPINATWSILNELKGTAVTRVHLFTLGEFTVAQKRAMKDSPLFFDIKDKQDFCTYIQETQDFFLRDHFEHRRQSQQMAQKIRYNRTKLFARKALFWFRAQLQG